MKTLLIFFFISLSSFAQNNPPPAQGGLTLWVTPSPYGLDWSSPEALLWSVQKNRLSFDSRPLGSVYSEIKCPDWNEVFTTSYRELDLFQKLVIEGVGEAILLQSFPGQLEKGEKLKQELAERIKEKKVRFIHFTLSQGHCDRLKKFIEVYEEKNVARWWGLPHKPLAGEGGTSPAFAMALVEVLGFKEQIFQESWIRNIMLDPALSGPPLTDKKISVFKLMGGEWANKKKPHHLLSFWDKELMYQWLELNLKNFPQADREGIKGINFERAQWPVPQGLLWKQN